MMKKKEKIKKNGKEFDFIVIGAGVSGLAASMYAARLGLRTLCLGKSSDSEMPIGGWITTTDRVENYPGFVKLSGTELAEKIRKHAESYDLATIKEARVLEVKKNKDFFVVKAEDRDYKGKAVLFATGTRIRKLEVPGGKEFENRGVAYCALCDAPLFKNKVVAVIGGSDASAKDALVLAEHAKKVYIIYRKEKIRAEPVNLDKVNRSKKIEIVNNTNVVEVKGDKVVKKVILDNPYKGSKELKLDGVFVAIGHIPLSQLVKNLGVELNEKGEIVMDHKTSETNVKGVFAAGDVADKPFKQAITGVAEGCTAAHSAYEYVSKGGA